MSSVRHKKAHALKIQVRAEIAAMARDRGDKLADAQKIVADVGHGEWAEAVDRIERDEATVVSLAAVLLRADRDRRNSRGVAARQAQERARRRRAK